MTNSRTIAAADALLASDYRNANAHMQDAFLLGFQGRRVRFSTHDEESAWELGMWYEARGRHDSSYVINLRKPKNLWSAEQLRTTKKCKPFAQNTTAQLIAGAHESPQPPKLES